MKRPKSIERERPVSATIVVERSGGYVNHYRQDFISVLRLIVAVVHACVLWDWLFTWSSVSLGHILHRIYPQQA